MKLYIAASYSAKVDYETGKVLSEYKVWLEALLKRIEDYGYSVFCALREDDYTINMLDLDAAFKLDMRQIQMADVLVALLHDEVSAGVQTEIGVAIARNKKVVLVHEKSQPLNYINSAICRANFARELLLPFNKIQLTQLLV